MLEKNFNYKFKLELDNVLFKLSYHTDFAGYICTCGFCSDFSSNRKNIEETEDITTSKADHKNAQLFQCPSCGTKTLSEQHYHYRSSIGRNEKISSKRGTYQLNLSTRGGYFSAYEAEIEYVVIQGELRSDVKLEVVRTNFNKSFFITEFSYEEYTSKGVKKNRIVGYTKDAEGNEHALTKVNFQEYAQGIYDYPTKYEFIKKFNCPHLHSVSGEVIWDIVNLYKKMPEEITQGYTGLCYNYVRDVSDFYKLKRFPKVYALIEDKLANEETINISYILRDFVKSEIIRDEDEFISKYEIARELMLLGLNDISEYTVNSFADFIYEAGLNKTERLEIIEKFERQAEIMSRQTFAKLSEGIKICKKYGIPFEKNPKELGIYIDKLHELCNIAQKQRLQSIETSNKNIKLLESSDMVGVAYKVGGFKLLESIIYATGYLKEGVPYLLLKKNTRTAKYYDDCILIGRRTIVMENYHNNTYANIKKIYTADSIITNEDEIKEYLENKLESKQRRLATC